MPARLNIVFVWLHLCTNLAVYHVSSRTISAIIRCQGPVGRNKLAQFRHRGSAFAIGLPELRKLVPAYIFRTSVDVASYRIIRFS